MSKATRKPPERVAPATKQAVDAPRQSMFSVAPGELVIVGYDTDDGSDHPLWDPSSSDEPDESLAESLGLHGQLQPIVIRKNGDRLEVVAGRNRTKAARLWNDANPERPIALRCTLSRGKTNVELAESVIAENEHRKDRPIVVKARMAQRLIEMGRTDQQVADLYRVQVTTLRGWLESLDMAPELQSAQETGEITKAQADAVADLTHKDQAAALEIARETGAPLANVAADLKGQVPRTSGRPRGNSHNPSSRPGLVEIRGSVEDKTIDDNAITWRQALQWVLGDRAYLLTSEDSTQ